MTTIGVLALLMFGLGPAGATLGVLAPMVGFGMFVAALVVRAALEH